MNNAIWDEICLCTKDVLFYKIGQVCVILHYSLEVVRDMTSSGFMTKTSEIAESCTCMHMLDYVTLVLV